MSKKKLILSILLFILLITVGIVLPTVWKHQHTEEKKAPKVINTDSKSPKQDKKAGSTKLEYVSFEKLSSFFSDSQIDDLKNQFLLYFKEINKTDLTCVTFLPAETSYPDKKSTLLIFQLSDESVLPVTYMASSGAFLFGDEKMQISKEVTTYEKATDDTLSSITTKEIEAQQEGGYANTTDAPAKDATPKDPGTQEDSAKKTPTVEEVQP